MSTFSVRMKDENLQGCCEMTSDRIQLLGPELLDQHRETVESFRRRADELGIDVGWHYLLDLTWIAVELGPPAGLKILDAGAGTGVMQWWLADRDGEVMSVDREDRSQLSMRFRLGYSVEGLEPGDLQGYLSLIRERVANQPHLGEKIGGVGRVIAGSMLGPFCPKAPGKVILNHGDLGNLSEFEDDTFDYVIGVSSLEHNQPDALKGVVRELERVLRPDGAIIATLAAAGDEDWFHEPSSGWCYTENTIKELFGLDPSLSTNYERYDEVLAALKNSTELREQLSDYYFRSGDNGMPWGRWDPKYVPVGVVKTKASSSETGPSSIAIRR